MYYTKDFDLQPGDKVRIAMPAQEPFPEGWAEGRIISANFYGEKDGWYIEFEKDKVSYGWDTGYGYWKQGVDGGTVEKLAQELNADFYMITPSGFDIAAVLAVFWNKLKYTSPTELELTESEVLSVVEMDEERKKGVRGILRKMARLGILDEYGR